MITGADTRPLVSSAGAIAPNGGLNAPGPMLATTIALAETAAGTLFTGTIYIPPNALLYDIIVQTTVLWTGTTSASLIVGDPTDADGFITATDLKATDLILGERLSIFNADSRGGVGGAYLHATTGRFGPATVNGMGGWYFSNESRIIAEVTRVGTTGAAGRTFVTALYAVPNIVSPVIA